MTIDISKLAAGWRRLRAPSAPLASPEKIIVGMAEDGVPVAWPTPDLERASHIVCLAASGAGKTVLVAHGLLQELVAAKELPPALQPSLFVIDPKGDLLHMLLIGLSSIDPGRLADVRYLNPFDQRGGFAFNLNRLALGSTPQDVRALQLAGLVAEISTATGAQKIGIGARQGDVLQHVLLGALTSDHPAANVLWALDALILPGGLTTLGKLTTSARARQFLLSADLSDELRASCASRLRTAFATTTALERMMATPTSVQFADLLAPGRLCFVDLGQPVGGLMSLQKFYANLICRLAIDHLLTRPSPWGGHHCRVVIDEAQIVAPVLSDIAELLLTTGRSRGLSITSISQGTTLIRDASETLLRVLLTNTPTKFIGRLAAPDAELLAREQAPGPGVEESMSAVRSRFVGSVCNLPDRTFLHLRPGSRTRFTSTEVDLARWQAAAAAQVATLDAVKRALQLAPGAPERVTLDAASSPRRRHPPRTPAPARTSTTANVSESPMAAPHEPPVPRSRWG